MNDPAGLSDAEILSSIRECIDLLRAEIAADESGDDLPRRLWQMVHGSAETSIEVRADGSVDASAIEHETLRRVIGPYRITWLLLKFFAEQSGRSRGEVLDKIDQAYLRRYGS